MKRHIVLASILFLGINFNSYGQDKYVTLSWNVGFPSSEMSEFLVNEDNSLAGFGLDYRKMLNEDVSAGFYFAWDFFNGDSDDLVIIDNVTISGQQRFFVNYLPIMLTGHYYFDSGKARPYIGGGAGAVATLTRTEVGSFAIQNNNWHFGLFPEAGIMIPVFNDKTISLGARYHHAFKTSDSINYSYASLYLGITSKLYD